MADEKVDLDELERIEKAATPGPWMPETLGRYPTRKPEISPLDAPKDANLIAALRSAAPYLIARARDAERLERLREADREALREISRGSLGLKAAEYARRFLKISEETRNA